MATKKPGHNRANKHTAQHDRAERFDHCDENDKQRPATKRERSFRAAPLSSRYQRMFHSPAYLRRVKIPGLALQLSPHFAHDCARGFATASMLKAVKINGSNPPMNRPMITFGSVREN